MKAYVELIQDKEKAIGCDVFTHQKWSGASYSDRVLNGKSLPPSFSSRETDEPYYPMCSCLGWIFSHRRRRGRFNRTHILACLRSRPFLSHFDSLEQYLASILLCSIGCPS
jgi:hypothetical protein